jgi:hypothetical protein
MTANNSHTSWKQLAKIPNQPVYQRQNAVRIRPAVDYPAVAERGDNSFVDAITHIVDEMNAGDRLEQLTYTGTAEQTETLLIHHPRARDSDETTQHTQNASPTQQTISDITDDSSTGDTPAAQAALQTEEEIKAIMGDDVTVDRVDWYPKPLGKAPLATCRFVLPGSEESARVSNANPPPVDSLMKELQALQKPFLYQVLIQKKDSHDIVITVRLTLVDNAQTITNSSDFFGFYEQSRDLDVGEIFEVANITTNFEMPLHKYYREIDPDQEWLFSRSSTTWNRATEARRIYTGEREYNRLFRGGLGYAEEYPNHLGYPKFPVELEHLQHFVTLPAIQYESDPWDDVHGRDAPHVEQTGRPLADVIDEGDLSHTFLSPDDLQQHEASAQRGSDAHDTHLNQALEWLRRRGYEVEKVPQKSNTSLPDGIGYDPNGTLVWIEYEHTLSSPENYLKNVARAVDADVKLILITRPDGGGTSDLDRIQTNLREPFKSQTPAGTVLYNRSQVTLEDNRKPLLPTDVSETKWFVTHNHELVLRGNHDKLASGPLNRSVETFDYSSPHYRQDGDKHIVEDAAGRTLDTYPSRNALFEDYTVVQKPHVPLLLSYAGVATLLYLGREDLESFDGTPGWADIDGKMLRYQRSAKRFIETFTVEKPDNKLPLSELHTYYKRWATRQTTKKLPNLQVFGKAINNIENKDYETSRVGEGGRDGKALKNRTWIYPPDVRSPDLPNFDADTLDRLEDLLND